MSLPEPAVPREPASYAVGGFLAAFALFAALGSLVYYPGRIGPGAMLIALIASAMDDPKRRLGALSVGAAGVCWFFGMVIAVLLDRPLF